MPKTLETTTARLRGTSGQTVCLAFGPIEAALPPEPPAKRGRRPEVPFVTQAAQTLMKPLKRGQSRAFVYQTSKVMPWTNFRKAIMTSAYRALGAGNYVTTREGKNTIRVYRVK